MSFSFKRAAVSEEDPITEAAVVDVPERERVLGALLLRLERGVVVVAGGTLDLRDCCSSGLGEEDVSCARGGGAMTSLREVAWEVEEEEVASLLLEPPLRKTCVDPLADPAPRRLLSEGLIVVVLFDKSSYKLG